MKKNESKTRSLIDVFGSKEKIVEFFGECLPRIEEVTGNTTVFMYDEEDSEDFLFAPETMVFEDETLRIVRNKQKCLLSESELRERCRYNGDSQNMVVFRALLANFNSSYELANEKSGVYRAKYDRENGIKYYTYFCGKSGLSEIIVPFFIDGKAKGAFFVGPFLKPLIKEERDNLFKSLKTKQAVLMCYGG
jgi:hypothetical protein